MPDLTERERFTAEVALRAVLLHHLQKAGNSPAKVDVIGLAAEFNQVAARAVQSIRQKAEDVWQ